MRWESAPDTLKPRHFAIEHDNAVRKVYFYVYDEKICTHDYLQHTFEIAVSFAHREFGVLTDSWIRTAK